MTYIVMATYVVPSSFLYYVQFVQVLFSLSLCKQLCFTLFFFILPDGGMADMEGKIFLSSICYNVDISNSIHLTTCLLHRLGHREQKDEWQPRLVEIFQRHNVLPPNAILSAGSANSACTAGMIQLSVMHRIFYNAFWCINYQEFIIELYHKNILGRSSFELVDCQVLPPYENIRHFLTLILYFDTEGV